MPTTFPRDTITMLIDGKVWGNWEDLEVKFSVDTYSTVSFTAPFEPTRKEFREVFRPFSFKSLEILLSLQPIFSGTLVDVNPAFDPNLKRVAVTGYAKPAVFHKCCAPANILPTKFEGLSLRGIAETLAAPFGIKCEFPDEDGTPFKSVKLDVDKKIQDFLMGLAKQRNRVLTNTFDGRLLGWKSVEAGKPTMRFEERRAPLGKVVPELKPEEYYSEVTGFATKKRRNKPARWTEPNKWLDSAVAMRPHSFRLDDTERGDAPEATKANMGRMFANMASYSIEDLPGWRDDKGEIFQPNFTLLLKAPSAMVYRETELLVRDVVLKKTPNMLSCTLKTVLPGAFSGQMPDELPWNEEDS